MEGPSAAREAAHHREAAAAGEAPALAAHHAEQDFRVDASAHAAASTKHVGHVHQVVAVVVRARFLNVRG